MDGTECLLFRVWGAAELLQVIGKIDVNAFAIETYWQDVAYHFARDELHFVCTLA